MSKCPFCGSPEVVGDGTFPWRHWECGTSIAKDLEADQRADDLVQTVDCLQDVKDALEKKVQRIPILERQVEILAKAVVDVAEHAALLCEHDGQADDYRDIAHRVERKMEGK